MKDIISDAILAAMICNHKTFFLASPLHIVSHDYHGQRPDTDSSQHYKRLDTDGAGVLGHSLRVSGLDLPDDDDGSPVAGPNSDALKQIVDKGVHHNNRMDDPKNKNSTEHSDEQNPTSSDKRRVIPHTVSKVLGGGSKNIKTLVCPSY